MQTFLNLELENIFFLHIWPNFCGDICIETRICLYTKTKARVDERIVAKDEWKYFLTVF